MSRKWIGGLVAVAAIGAGAFAASSVLGADSAGPVRPAYATVTVDLSQGHAQAPAPLGGRIAGEHKPEEEAEDRLPAEPVADDDQPRRPDPGGVGPNIDIKLTGCSKVMDGGVVPSRPDVFIQGSFIKSSSSTTC